jgi:hypothetical protein
LGARVRLGGDEPAASQGALQAGLAHQPFHCAAGDRAESVGDGGVAAQQVPHLAGPGQTTAQIAVTEDPLDLHQ